MTPLHYNVWLPMLFCINMCRQFLYSLQSAVGVSLGYLLLLFWSQMRVKISLTFTNVLRGTIDIAFIADKIYDKFSV